MATPEDIINSALATAAAKATQADQYASSAMNAAQGYSFYTPNQIAGSKPGDLEPAVHIPTQAAGVDSALYQSTYDAIVGDLGQKFADFFNEYFPEDTDYLTAAQEWIHRALTAGGTGVNVDVEDKTYQRDRERVLLETRRATQDVTTSWAARGFPMPTGALNGALVNLNLEAMKLNAEASRERAITTMQLEVENARLAVDKAMNYRVSAIQAAGEYIKVMALGPQIASDMATSAANAQSSLISAASSYYNARISLHSLVENSRHKDADRVAGAGQFNAGNHMQSINVRAQTAASMAQSMGQQAAAALNAVNATAQVISYADQ